MKTDLKPTLLPRASIRLFIITIGLAAVSTNLIIGTNIGENIGFWTGLVAVSLSGIILAGIAANTAYWASQRQENFIDRIQRHFGKAGAITIGTFAGLVVFGWVSIQFSLLTEYYSNVLHTGSVGRIILCMIFPLAMSTTAYIGIRGISWISNLAVPAIFAMCIVALLGNTDDATKSSVEATMSFGSAMSLAFSVWIMGATATVADIYRHSDKPPVSALSAFSAFLIGNTIITLTAIYSVHSYGEGDLGTLLDVRGLPWLGALLLTLNIWTTNDNALYSASINLATSSPLKREHIVWIMASVSALLCIYQVHHWGVLFLWLNALGGLVPPLAGVLIIIDWLKTSPSPTANWSSYFAGVIGYFSIKNDYSTFLGLLISAAVATGLHYSRKSKMFK